jgi:hypothetical protein
MSAEDPFATLARRHADERPDWRLSGANTAPIDFGIESLSQTGVLERKLVDWSQQELSLPASPGEPRSPSWVSTRRRAWNW